MEEKICYVLIERNGYFLDEPAIMVAVYLEKEDAEKAKNERNGKLSSESNMAYEVEELPLL